MDENNRYFQIQELTLKEMAEFLSWYFDCSRCSARKDNCSDNDAMCMDALVDWLKQEGTL